jgi:hypothetical protein
MEASTLLSKWHVPLASPPWYTSPAQNGPATCRCPNQTDTVRTPGINPQTQYCEMHSQKDLEEEKYIKPPNSVIKFNLPDLLQLITSIWLFTSKRVGFTISIPLHLILCHSSIMIQRVLFLLTMLLPQLWNKHIYLYPFILD